MSPSHLLGNVGLESVHSVKGCTRHQIALFTYIRSFLIKEIRHIYLARSPTLLGQVVSSHRVGDVCTGRSGLAQVRGSPDGGGIGIVGAVRVKAEVKWCHMAVLNWDYEAAQP